MKRLLLVLTLLALLVVPAMADYNENFQDYAAQDWVYTTSASGTVRIYTSGELVELNLITSGPAGEYARANWDIGYPTNYIAWSTTVANNGGIGSNTFFYLYNSDKTLLATFDFTSVPYTGVWEIIRNPTTGVTTVLCNGATIPTIPPQVLAVSPSYIEYYVKYNTALAQFSIDNFHTGSSEPRYWISTIPPNWTVVRDFINPANSGLYATNPAGVTNLVRTNYMYSNWSRGNNTDTTIGTISLKNVATGISYETLGVGTSSTYNRRVINNLSVLTAPTSTAPNGLYELTMDTGSGVNNHAYFWLTSTGATITWDKDKYYTDENSISTWSITPAYWDTGTYSYQGAIVDAYGTSKKTWTITAASGTEHTTMSSTTYPQGVYYNKLTATLKAAPFTAYILDTDYTEVTQDIKLSGLTYNATTNTTQPHVFINFTQTGLGTVNTTSHTTTAAYNKTGFFSSVPIVINPVQITNYQPLYFVPVSFTPLSYGNFTINLYGTKDVKNQTGANSTIYGLVQGSPYYNALDGATVRIWNNTVYSWFLTNATGFYNFTELLPFSEYQMNASYTGYTSSANVVVNSSSYYKTVLYNATRKDFLLSTTYNVSVTIVDIETHDPIPGATVSVTDGTTTWSSTASSIGVAYFDLVYGLYSITPSAGGYYSTSSSHIIDSDDSITISLTPLFSQASILQDYPHYVVFRTMKLTGGGIPDVAVTAQGYMTSTGSYDWLVDWIGIPIKEAPIHNTTMSATTDDYGAVTFLMVPTVKYNMTFTLAGYTFTNLRLMPQDNEYIIYPTGLPGAIFYPTAGMSELEAVNISITTGPKTASVMFVNISYYDKLGHTMGGYVDVLLKNETPFGANLINYRWNVSDQKNPWTGALDKNNWTNSSEVSHVVQVSGFVNTNVTNTDFGYVKRSYGFTFNSIPVSFLGFGYEIALLVAMGIMLFTAMLGGASSAKQVAFIVCIEAWVFYAMHWFDALIDRGVPAEVISMALLIATVFAFVSNMGVRKRKEKY